MSRLKNEQLGQLLDRIYTIEGLIELALSRKDYDEKIQRLISINIFRLADQAALWDSESLMIHREEEADIRAALADENSSYELEEDEENILTTPQSESNEKNIEKKNDSANIAIEEKLKTIAEESNQIQRAAEQLVVKEMISEDVLTQTANASMASQINENIHEIDEIPTETTPVTEKDAVLEAIEEIKVTEEKSDANPLMATVNAAPENEAAESGHLMATVNPIPEKEEAKADGATNYQSSAGTVAKPRPVFSLNDRYFFTRTLFHNSHKEFENTLQLIASMENFDEAEDYFINELEWNPEESTAKQFIDIIHRYFDALQ
ncbi:MAG: hypothetical protein NC201_04900 [Prevotella sp.]|nr:hypothetical protein [Bacteroides sp.]MCM1366568.1 hypothetical protein [Prevotella sp.]MCM1437237.1 hypothetical protein [Prevotella sp.]